MFHLWTNELQRRHLFLYTQIRRVEQAMLRRSLYVNVVHRIAVPRGVENVTSKRVERPLVSSETVLNHARDQKERKNVQRYQGREIPQKIFMYEVRHGLPPMTKGVLNLPCTFGLSTDLYSGGGFHARPTQPSFFLCEESAVFLVEALFLLFLPLPPNVSHLFFSESYTCIAAKTIPEHT